MFDDLQKARSPRGTSILWMIDSNGLSVRVTLTIDQRVKHIRYFRALNSLTVFYCSSMASLEEG